MRMFRLSSWISESRGCDRVVNGPEDLNMANATRPVVEIVSTGLGKRRRSSLDEGKSGMEEDDALDAKRRKSSTTTSEAVLDSTGEEAVNESVEPLDPTSRIRDAIESQFGLEILLKHKELRLINQELAKCQAALEQLRRCHLIPFPPSVANPLSLEDVSNGTGPAVGLRDRVPKWAPPFGVTDGPYSRHYTKWLIPDPSFDGVEAESSEGSRAGKSVLDGRSTRNSFNEGSTPASKSRSQRGTASQKLQALPSGYPPVKEKAGPCVLKRGDGQWVKLICIDCQRHDFSSTQGFINHCRISHRRDFKSHEEAAVACGHPAEFDDAGRLVGEEKTPAVAPGVHPMIRSTPYDKAAYSALMSRIQSSLDMYNQGNLPGVNSIPSTTSTPRKLPVTPNANFVPSSTTPHLSELMRSRGFGGNLNDIVDEAKTQPTFDEYEDSEHSDEEQVNPGNQPMGVDGANSPLPIMRMPARVGVSSAPLGRPTSSKGIDARHGRQPGMSSISPRMFHATPVINTATHGRPGSRFSNTQMDGTGDHLDLDIDMEMMDGPSIIDLSPNTVASNNAPSLVSDDGEYDEGDDAPSATSADEDEDSDVAEINIDDDNMEKVIPRTVLRNRAGSVMRKEDKHVSFVSPVKDGNRDRRARKA
ncbi:hypothetical protein BKA65DRAFT_245944 [Rhexocercosporidium sp. MPI-PUGE-AT-0058]|nr:hypothetical protein BKA65DRAFT_245944 [Rhexocercosporidium sp. MPI-PUGE-AT-0058]